ncbi:DUF86 domain-containing protein [Patescibacteria group bacterium]|nr:DUF86 domain-containing protein [Patescibacteria group bacterium]
MTKQNVVENKLSSVQKYLKILERYQDYSQQEIETDIDLRGSVERYLYLAVQSTIDLAESIVASKDFRKPTTMSESFLILEEEKIIDSEMAETMIKMTGFRNIVAHDYEDLDYKIVYNALHKGLNDIKKFLLIAKKV